MTCAVMGLASWLSRHHAVSLRLSNLEARVEYGILALVLWEDAPESRSSFFKYYRHTDCITVWHPVMNGSLFFSFLAIPLIWIAGPLLLAIQLLTMKRGKPLSTTHVVEIEQET